MTKADIERQVEYWKKHAEYGRKMIERADRELRELKNKGLRE